MSERPDDDILILAEFHDHYLSECDAGRTPQLEDFLARFPGHEELIRAEFAALQGDALDTQDTRTTESSRAGHGQVAHYRLIRVLGSGGQAVVWLAEDERVGRQVALKLVRCDPLDAPAQLARFKREAALTARIDHPAICPMLDLGLDAQPFIAMRYVPGQTLAEILRQEKDDSETATDGVVRLPSASDREARSMDTPSASRSTSLARRQRGVLVLIEKVARAIHAAHEQGIVHRDLKPNNIMVKPDGEPVVLDFGVAFEEDGDGAQLTATGDVIGTPSYLAPEQITARRGRVDRRTDVHALGVILFECLTLKRPYTAPNREALFRMILHEEAPRLRAQNPALSTDLEVVVEMALQKNPAHRYVDALALAEDLRRVLDRRPILARPIGAFTRGLRWAERNPQLATALGAVVLLLSVGLIVTTILLRDTKSALSRESQALDERNEAFDEILRQKQGMSRLRSQATLHKLEREANEELWPLAVTNADELEAMIARIDAWLAQASQVAAGLESADAATGAPSHRHQLELLRRRARPRSEEDLIRDRQAHPRHEALPILKRRREAEARALRIRDGSEGLQLPAVDPASIPEAPPLHMRLIHAQVRGNRTDFGEEAEGLARARILEEAIQGVDDPGARFWVGSTLAWAELANGLDLSGRRNELAEVCERLGPTDLQRGREELAHLDAAIAAREGEAWNALVAELDREVEKLERELSAHRRFEFDSDEDQWWHDNLVDLIERIEHFAGAEGPIHADRVEEGWSLDHRRAHLVTLKALADENRTEWAATRKRIRSNPAYAGFELPIQIGLVPLGPDPKSGLEEFWDPAGGSRPMRDDASARLRIGEDTGLVFILVPGGTFSQGAQALRPDAAGYDPTAGPQEGPVLRRDLEPFFLSKFELTQGQFLRLASTNPSTQGPGFGHRDGQRVHDLSHPVETLNWKDADRVLRRFGWSLPTETQWEYAARAGTTTPWWRGTDPSDLGSAGNIADATAAKRPGLDWPAARVGQRLGIDDGQVFHAPVGSYEENPFGFADTIGNVAEWCDGRTEVPARDGGPPSSYRNSRGGHFMSEPRQARVTMRQLATDEAGFDTIGVRPARPIR